MKFCWITLMVKNMDNSVKFYNEIVGLKLNRRFSVKPGFEISFMGDGETEIELICDDLKEDINNFFSSATYPNTFTNPYDFEDIEIEIIFTHLSTGKTFKTWG